MIPVLLRDLLPRIGLVGLAGAAFYLLEPAFHQHGGEILEGPEMGPLGVAASLGNLASLAMVILLADMVSGDRRRGTYQILFSHPTRPLALYGLRWGVSLLVALLAALLLLVVGQLIAWGEFRGGLGGMPLVVAAAVAFGGLVAGVSTLLPRGDAWVAVGGWVVTYIWLETRALGADPLPGATGDVLLLLLPPMGALQDLYAATVLGEFAPGAFLFACGYGVVWLLIGALALRFREWG